MVRSNAPISTASELKLLREALVEYITAMTEGGIDVNSMSLVDLVATTVTATASQHLTLQGVTGKDIKVKLTDNAGARKLLIYDSDNAEIASIDSNGVVTAVQGVINTINAAASTHLAINGVTGKDIKFKLTDNAGARKIILLDSDDAEVMTIDSNGAITATSLTGDVTGNLTGSVVNNAVAAIDFASGHADYTLSASEKKALVLSCVSADQAANIIAPAENRMYIVKNGSGAAITIKKSAGTGITVADGKTAIVYYNGTDYARATADATH